MALSAVMVEALSGTRLVAGAERGNLSAEELSGLVRSVLVARNLSNATWQALAPVPMKGTFADSSRA